MPQIRSIQILRATAALSEAFGHLQSESLSMPAAAASHFRPILLDLTGAGVDLFFIISGFVTPTVSYTYNNWGLLETVTEARGTSTRYVYTQGTPDEAYGQPNGVFAPGVTPVPGLLPQTIEDFGGDNLTTIRRDFNGAGQPETTIGPGGHLITTYTYDGMNRVLNQSDAVGIVTTYSYDGRGNLTRQIVDYTPDGVSGRNVVTEYTYNAYDQVLTERTSDNGLTIQNSTFYDINRQIALTQDGRGHATIYRYDSANQIIHVIDPAGKGCYIHLRLGWAISNLHKRRWFYNALHL